MGNRAVIATEKKDFGVYLHWNGGRDSVEAFLLYCRLRGFRPPEEDNYGWARLCQVLGNFFGKDGSSVGIGPYGEMDTDNYDNGVYVIRDWRVVGREYKRGFEQTSGASLLQLLADVNRAQPEAQRLTYEELYKGSEDAGPETHQFFRVPDHGHTCQ